MPEIPTYTASGQTRGGPVLADTPAEALTAPYRALERTGYQVAQLGSDVAQIAEQRKRENDLTWASESRAQFDRTLIERQAEDAKNPRETMGHEFRDFADEQLNEYTKTAPSKQAAEMFREHAQSSANRGYSASLQDGETVRLLNANRSNVKATADMIAAYKYEQDISILNDSYKFQVASIQSRYGESMPKMAASMTQHVVEEVALGTASTNPAYAHKLVDQAPISEELKLQINTTIDRINASSDQLEQHRFMRSVENSYTVAEGALLAGKPAQFPNKLDRSSFSLFGKNADNIYDIYSAEHDTKKASFDILSSTTGKNANAQKAILNDAFASGDPEKIKGATHAAERVSADIQQQRRDPVDYLETKNDQLKIDREAMGGLTEDSGMKQQAVGWYYGRLLELQGHPPPGADNPDDYLGLDETHVLSAAKADALKQQINNASLDYTTFITDTLPQQFGGDPVLTERAYHDMLTLGNEKLPVAYKFTGIINDVNTKKGWTAAQKQGKALAEKFKSDKTTDYTDVLNKGDYDKLWRAWKGPNYERTDDINEATQGMMNYAYTLRDNLTPRQAMEEAVRRVVTANYGFAEVHGQIVPIGKKRLLGGPDRTDNEIADIGRSLQIALKDVPIQEVQLKDPFYGAPHFSTLSPSFKMENPEDAQTLRDIVTSSGFWVMEPHGEVVKLYVREPGGEPFALLDKRNQPFQFKLDDLPKFYSTTPAVAGIYSALTEIPGGVSVPVGPEIKQTYPIVEKASKLTARQRLKSYQLFGPFSFFGGLNPQETIRTNWPVRGSYYQGGGSPKLGESP